MAAVAGVRGATASSTARLTKYRPQASRDTVTIFGIPMGSRDQRSFSAPRRGSTRRSPATNVLATLRWSSCRRIEPACRRFLKRGNRARPAKKLVKAVSRSRSRCTYNHRRRLVEPSVARGLLQRCQQTTGVGIARGLAPAPVALETPIQCPIPHKARMPEGAMKLLNLCGCRIAAILVGAHHHAYRLSHRPAVTPVRKNHTWLLPPRIERRVTRPDARRAPLHFASRAGGRSPSWRTPMTAATIPGETVSGANQAVRA